MKRVCHITTVHSQHDTRIFLKECKALKEAGYEVFFVVTASKDEEIDGIRIYSVPNTRGRFVRIIGNTILAARKALDTGAEIFHFHDPELIPVGLYLKTKGKKVIYDVHEDVPEAILTKEWIPFPMRKIISSTVRIIENWSSRHFDVVVAATPHICSRFANKGCVTYNVNNYPLCSEFDSLEIDWRRKIRAVCYIGVIVGRRGIFEMVEAITRTDVRLLLGGIFGYEEERMRARSLPGWVKVDELGYLDRKEVADILSISMAGLVLFPPLPNHTESQPNKIFEYMAAGLPVIASHFPLWKEIVEGNGCGLCVDPQDPEAISKAITWIVDHPVEAENMGRRGQVAVQTRYNWGRESKVLIGVYRDL